jgi:hypothetical protein
MALNDRYNRGGGRLENLDRYLTHLGDRFGDFWWERTGLNRAVLTQALYLLAAWAALHAALWFHRPLLLGIAGVALVALLGKTPISRGGLVEEMQVEVLGLPRRTFVVLRLWLLGLGLLNLAQATGELALAAGSGLPPSLQGVEFFLTGCAFTALQAADYIRRTNPSTPSGGLWTT